MSEKHSNVSRITVRMPAEVQQKLRESAKKEHRSVNSQIVKLLQDGLKSAA